VTLITSDNLKIAAWFVPSSKASDDKPSDKVIILLHGYPFDKANLLSWAEFLQKDSNLFFFDFRYFGESEGSMTTVGYHEQKDLKSALDYLQKRGFNKIGLMGFSLGGAVAIMTASYDKRVKAVVSDSAFANINLMIDEYYRNLPILRYPLSILTNFWTLVFIGVNPDEVAPEKVAENIKIPVLLIHSKKDQVIPFENAIRIQKSLKNNPKSQFFFFEEGSHGGVPENLEKEYQKKVLEFFRQNL
jgi:pimeloyl-ACP methyl ester carboxylesterase